MTGEFAGERPRTAVITIAAGREDHLQRQREALADSGAALHVVVSMAVPPDLSPVRGAPPIVPVTVTADARGLPMAAARNAGARAAIEHDSALLVFLDVDCIPGPAALDHYAAAAAKVPAATLMCGPVAYLPPPPPEGYPTAAALAGLADPHPGRPAPPPGEIVLDDQRFELFWSLSFATSAADWRHFGGFCELFRGYGAEDTDFALLAASRGARLAWVGGATVYHQHHPPSRHHARHVRELVANARLFHRRHGTWPMSTWLTELAHLGVVEFDRDDGHLLLLPDHERILEKSP